MASPVLPEVMNNTRDEFADALKSALGGTITECDENIEAVIHSQEALSERLDGLTSGRFTYPHVH